MRPELKYGLIAGLSMSLWLLLEFLLGLHGQHIEISAYTNWGTESILIVTLWFFLRHKLTTPYRYWLPVWQGLLFGMLTGLIAGMVTYIYYSFYLQYLNPEWPDLYINWQVAQLRAEPISEEKVLVFARSFRWSVTPLGLVTHIIGLNTLLGGLVSCVLTLWLNWRNKEPVQLR